MGDIYGLTDYAAWAPALAVMVAIIPILTEATKAALRTLRGPDVAGGFAPLMAIAWGLAVGLVMASFIGKPLVGGLVYGLVACALGVLGHTAATAPARAREHTVLKAIAHRHGYIVDGATITPPTLRPEVVPVGATAPTHHRIVHNVDDEAKGGTA